MLKHSRVTGSIDTGRLSQAVSRPGIDPRTWVSLAIINRIVVDPDEGPFVDVTLMPSLQEKTARVGAEYAGNRFGLWAPLEVDDEVVVEAPSGDPDEGLIVVRRLYSASDPPPQEAVDAPEDFLLVIKPGRTLRLITKGEGNLVVEAQGDGEVRLGAETATRGVARDQDVVSVTAADITSIQAVLDARYALNPGPPIPVLPGTIGRITSSSSKVRST